MATGAPIPATTGQVFIVLGAILVFCAAFAWARRNDFAKSSRQRFDKLGWSAFARQMKDDRWRRVAVFFAILWAVFGIPILLIGVVLSLTGS